jgi:Heparinase II/III-like protein/Heparinase II/III N-terminus
MGIKRKIRRALRGRIGARAALLEAGRRGVVALRGRRERASLLREGGRREVPARLAPDFERMSGAQLLAHFRSRTSPRFFEGFGEKEDEGARATDELIDDELIDEARAVVAHRWPLLGYGVIDFGREIDWLREPVSGVRWPHEYHGDVALVRGDGSDVRVLWELNRLGQLLTLARAYAATRDESLTEEFFAQVDGWRAQNPFGFGPNWACAMEAALRSTNLLAAFEALRRSAALNESRLAALLSLFDAHGRHLRRNLEYSYIATGNHYLSDVAGLLWLGLCLPELEAARAWRDFALKELLRELDAQVLPDGADCEASTGYHRFVTELFLYSFLLCRANGVRVDERHWARLRSMLEYVRAYLRPDGRAPLVGDTDGGQFLPLVRRDADDHAYLLGVGAALFREPRFKLFVEPPHELSLLLGPEGARAYRELETAGLHAATSSVFRHAGACVLREGDLYLMLNASGAGLGGRGAHGHNDALSLEVSACGVSFLTDPGTYVYTSDLRARGAFRSTAYHSTVEVDGVEQNTTEEAAPFLIGDESRPRVIDFETGAERDAAVAEHRGYERLRGGRVTHRRSVTFDKASRFWLVEDAFEGAGAHDFRFVFHAAPGLEVGARGTLAELRDASTGARLLIVSPEGRDGLAISPRLSSNGYGSKRESAAAVWTLRASAPHASRWLLVPVRAGEDERARLELARAKMMNAE